MLRSLPLRRRMTVAVAIAVAIAVVLASTAAYFAVRGELRTEVDDALTDQPLACQGAQPPFRGPPPRLRAAVRPPRRAERRTCS